MNRTTPIPEYCPIYTIWGKADDKPNRIAEGIYHVTTPSHGGYWLSAKRYWDMPEQLRACSFTNDNWFEEDCSWCAVVLVYPEYFDAEHRNVAANTYNAEYAKKYGQLTSNAA